MKNKVLITTGLVIAAATIIFLLGPLNDSGDSAPAIAAADATAKAGEQAIRPVNDAQSVAVQDKQAAMFRSLQAQLQKKMEGRWDRPFWRLKMLRDLSLFFKEQFPETWEEELIAFLRFAFPDRSAELIKKFHALQEYEAWLESLKNTMKFASQEERRQAMWDKRVALFGEEAYQIFEAALKTEKFEEKMNALAASTGSFEEKQQQYFDSLRDVFGPQAVTPDAQHKAQKMVNFLNLDNVQQDLRSMPAQQQAAALRSFRVQMGLDEAALARWEALDAQRAQNRATGEKYMSMRSTMTQQFSGAELESRLTSLRDELFGKEDATAIRNEELSGFYRFHEPQKIGID